jgi:hypothetical protein
MASGIRFYPGDRGRLESRNVVVLEVVHFASQLNTQVFGRLRRLLREINRHSILPHPWPRRPPELLADLGVDDVLNADRGDPLAGGKRDTRVSVHVAKASPYFSFSFDFSLWWQPAMFGFLCKNTHPLSTAPSVATATTEATADVTSRVTAPNSLRKALL